MIESTIYHQSKAEIEQEQRVIAAAKLNPAQFSVLYDSYFEPLFRFVYQRLDDRELAFDTVQQIFLKALDNIKKYENRGLPFASWLYRIARNELATLFRKQKAQQTINIDSVNVFAIIEEIEETKIDKYHDTIVNIIKEQLNEEELNLIEMRFFEKRSFAQIGEILNITENYAKVKTYRVLDKLKKIISTKN